MRDKTNVSKTAIVVAVILGLSILGYGYLNYRSKVQSPRAEKDKGEEVKVEGETPQSTESDTSSQDFDYDKYEPIKYDDFVSFIYEDYKSHQDTIGPGPGLSLFLKNLIVSNVVLPSMPTKINEKDFKTVSTLISTANLPMEAVKAFTHKLIISHEKLTINLFFQNVLIPYLDQEKVVGRPIDIVGVLVSGDTSTGDINFLVNEFNAGTE